MEQFTATPASEDRYRLGEGPIGDPNRDRVLWVDILGHTVFEGRLIDGRVEATAQHRFDEMVGAVAPAADGSILVAAQETMVVIDAAGERHAGPRIVAAGAPQRLNDGAVDPAGRYLVGTLSLDGPSTGEKLVRVDADRSVTTIDDDLTLSNGLGWSADGSILYSVDTKRNVVFRRSYDPATGEVGERSEWVRVEDNSPDGLTVDAEDHVWVAVFRGGEVRRFDPDGRQVAVVSVSAPQTSCPAFVGADRSTMLITTADKGMSEEALAEYPDSGRLFTVDLPVPGLPTTPWAGFNS